MGRGMRTVKGALTALVGIFFALFCMSSWLISGLVAPHEPAGGERLDFVRRFGPLGLLALCLLQLFYSSGEKAVVAFTPPETNFLIAGPFSRRQLLGYKIAVNFLSLLVAAVFFLFWFAFLRVSMELLLARYLGLVLALFFVQLFSISLGFIAASIGAAIYNRTRKLLLLVLIALVLFGVYRSTVDSSGFDFRAMLANLEATPVLHTLLEPLRYFSRALAAEQLWPDFALWGSLSLAIDLGLLVLVFVLDAWQLEVAATAGERLYAQIQRIRSGGAAAAVLGRPGKRRFSLPALPWFGGAGPVAWRQLTAVPRSRSSLAIVFLLIPLVIIPLLQTSEADSGRGSAISVTLSIQVFVMTFFLTPLLAFDFRGDIERMEVLRTLPIASSALVVGQLLTPVFILSAIQWIDLAVITLALQRPDVLRGAFVAAALALPFNFFLVGVDNLLFLLFPTRLVATVGDFQVYGRQLLLQLAKLFLIGLAVGITVVLAVPAYFLFGQSLWAAGTIAGFTFLGFGIGIVPLVAMAFRRFDVTRIAPA
jgi:hypothetical protein